MKHFTWNYNEWIKWIIALGTNEWNIALKPNDEILNLKHVVQYEWNIVGADGGEDAWAVGVRGEGAGPVGEASPQEPQLHVRRAGPDSGQAPMSGRIIIHLLILFFLMRFWKLKRQFQKFSISFAFPFKKCFLGFWFPRVKLFMFSRRGIFEVSTMIRLIAKIKQRCR
jgi:hypothetical protein